MSEVSRANWFVALPIRAEGLEARIPPAPSGLRRLHVDDLHATVAFLGHIDAEIADRAFASLPSSPGPEPTISLGDVVPMGRTGAYSALSALVEEGREALEAHMSALRDAVLEGAGLPPERRPMKAHVTLARPSRRATPAEREQGLAWARALDVKGVAVRLDRIALYTWDERRAERLFRIARERGLEPA